MKLGDLDEQEFRKKRGITLEPLGQARLPYDDSSSWGVKSSKL